MMGSGPLQGPKVPGMYVHSGRQQGTLCVEYQPIVFIMQLFAQVPIDPFVLLRLQIHCTNVQL